MSRSVWRIATDTKDYEADDLTGAGAKATGGRWNASGIPMLYCSESRALACLETLVHLNAGGLPLNRYLVEIIVPDDVWAARQIETAASLKVGWDAEPAGRVGIGFGTDWVSRKHSLLLSVPSVIVPEETNILVNPEHPDRSRLVARKLRKWVYDRRVAGAA
ncbi:MAG TPA: RES family NAD+ phosphorylase [Allosphingosinicella sp.]|nr:RES family NAD+ phosphorylase [Allosphingosinicella sp.]